MSTPATKRAMSSSMNQVVFGKPIKIDRERVFVNPPTFHLCGENPPKAIRWENQTGGPVMIWLPNADHCLNRPPEGDFSKPFVIPPKGELLLTVKEHPKKGKYEYHVYCEVIKDYAEGNSPPNLSCP
jgi:hypothetical protein